MFQSPLNTQKYNVSAKIIQLDQKPTDVVLVAHRWLCIRCFALTLIDTCSIPQHMEKVGMMCTFALSEPDFLLIWWGVVINQPCSRWPSSVSDYSFRPHILWLHLCCL